MEFVRDWRSVVASVAGAAFVWVGVVGCASSEEVVDHTPRATATATVRPAATKAVVVGPTATIVPVTPTAIIEATATAVVVQPTVTMVPATPTAEAFEPTTTVEVEADDYADSELASLTNRAYELTIMLAEELSPRQSATEEELAAAMYLLREMVKLGYEVEIQDFAVTETGPSGSIEVMASADGGEPEVLFSRRSGNTSRIFFLPFEPAKTGEVAGELVYVGLGSDEDFEGVDVEGKIALIARGNLTFEEKETNAAERGALGAVVFNNQPRYYFGGRLEGDPDVLVGGIPREDGVTLRDALDDGEDVVVELLVYPDGDGPSRNVIAELNNDIVGDRVLVIGAHYDTTPWSPGANDNGSGVASVLVVAEELADDDLPFDVRFIFFGSEETGLHGSNHYAGGLSQAEVDRIVGMINLDVVATGDLEVFGDEMLTEYASHAAEATGVDLEVAGPLEGAASDHVGFDERGVPFIMFYADELDYINHPSDTVEHVEAEPLGGTVVTVLGLVERLADSIEE